MTLPICRHRGEHVAAGYVCRSNRLIHDGIVDPEVCEACPYADLPLDNGATDRPWTNGKPCRHAKHGGCQLAAAIAAVPTASVPVTGTICGICQFSNRPTLDQPNEMVAYLANKAGAQIAVTDGLRPDEPAQNATLPADPSQYPCDFRSAKPVEYVQCRPCQNLGLNKLPVYGCTVHGKCVVSGYSMEMQKVCLTCPDRSNLAQSAQNSDTPKKPQESAVKPVKCFVFNRNDQPADWLGDQYPGASCVLACGGPSLGEMDLSRLNDRGVFVASVSQSAATLVRPQAWFSVDPCKTYHPAIWKDPAIMKFVSRSWRGHGDDDQYPKFTDKWVASGVPVRKCPNVYFYDRGDKWSTAEYLDRPYAMWRTAVLSEDRTKASVMLAAIRLLYWLGFRSVYLIGCDFHMTRERQYAFPSGKGSGAYRTNNKTFAALNLTFAELRPVFASHGFHVYNATPGGNLTTLDRVTFDQAVDDCLAAFPAEIDVTGLYH